MSAFIILFVAKLGLEPRQTEPESVVLPLHHLAICQWSITKPDAKVLLFCETTKYIDKKTFVTYRLFHSLPHSSINGNNLSRNV